ncbi:MAG: hypothetical protein M0010_14835, partial [Actinomycetota bacterium]|nr:hypothetical protein [Actinomycetota bacterium]
MASAITDSMAAKHRRPRTITAAGTIRAAGSSAQPGRPGPTAAEGATARRSSPTAAAPREREGSWWWLLAIVPLLFCCGGPLILAALATVSAATLGTAGGIAGGLLAVAALGW